MQPLATLLVVDDDRGLADLMHYGLSGAGYAVLLAHTAADALALLRTQHPDLVLLDVHLPDMSGFATLAVMRTMADVPVIMLSGYDRGPAGRDSATPDAYLIKPISIHALLARVATTLQRTARGPSALREVG